MTRILLVSDMHFGFTEKTISIWEKYWKKNIPDGSYDLCICAGDLGTAKLKHFEVGIKFLSKYSSAPVLLVRGNHDLWDKGITNIDYLLQRERKICKKHNVHLLQDEGPFILKDTVRVSGWDGWYDRIDPPTKDEWLIPGGSEHFFRLQNTAYENVDKISQMLSHESQYYDVVVTHMPCLPGIGNPNYNANPRYGEELIGKCVAMLFGHSHMRMDATIQGTRVCNAGSDYDKPNHMIIEIG